MELVKKSNQGEQELIQKAIKYCVELSLYKLLNTLEYGIGNYTFDLVIKKGNKTFSLINSNDDNELSTDKFFTWLK